MFELITELLLIFHFSLAFSLMLLCIVFYSRTRDRIVFRLLIILIPLFLHSFATLFYYLFSKDLNLLIGKVNSAISLFLLVLTSFTVPMILYGTSNYMLSLLEIPEKRRAAGKKIIFLYSAFFSLLGLYFIIFIHGDDWMEGLSKALNEMFVFGGFFMFFPTMTAMIFYRKIRDSRKKRLLRGLIISFSPLISFASADLIFFMTSPYKLVFLSFFIFSILVYLDTARQYIHKYDPEYPLEIEEYKELFGKLQISDREWELIPLLLEGKSNREISSLLYISPNTVKSHIRNIYKKTGAANRLQLLSILRHHPKR